MIRWGICGTGGVSGLFAEAVAASADGEVISVGNRSSIRAQAFAATWGIRSYGNYETLGMLGDIDAVYVALPPVLHRRWTEFYLEHGKHVLCEKPLAMNAQQAQAMADLAAGESLFLMEAMWCRFLPAYVHLTGLLRERFCGDLVMMDASFGIQQPNRRRPEFSAELGGGALRTGGVYTVQLATLCLGTDLSVQASGHVGEVDESFAALLTNPAGQVASVSSSIVASLSCAAHLYGTQRSITLPSVHSPQDVADTRTPYAGPRLLPEVEHVHECLAAGLTESPVMGLAESCAIARIMDEIRRQL